MAGGVLHYCSVLSHGLVWKLVNGKGMSTHLSMMAIRGATVEAAANPEHASDANLKPRFFVFHFFSSIGGGSTTWGTRVVVFEAASRSNGTGTADPTLGP